MHGWVVLDRAPAWVGARVWGGWVGPRNGFRPRRVQTLEGELKVEIPQVRAAAEPFVSKLFPRNTKLLRTEPLRAMVIGAFVRGLSIRGSARSCASASSIFKRRGLYGVQIAALFLDAVFLAVRPDGPKEGARRVGVQRGGRAGAAGSDARDARIPPRLACARVSIYVRRLGLAHPERCSHAVLVTSYSTSPCSAPGTRSS